MNQCDGCRAGKPLIDGKYHRMGERGAYPDFMSCTAAIYADSRTSAPTQNGSE